MLNLNDHVLINVSFWCTDREEKVHILNLYMETLPQFSYRFNKTNIQNRITKLCASELF